MKKTIFLALVSVVLASCSSNEKTAKSKIEEFIQANANDPGSFEFINMENPDTLRISDTLEISAYLDSVVDLDVALSSLEISQESFDEYSTEINGEYGYIYKESYETSKAEVEQYSKEVEKERKEIAEKQSKIKELKKHPEKDQIVSINYTMNFRIKNGFGALKKSSASIKYIPKKETWETVKISKS